MMAVSTVKAQDTLKIESLRTIDVCSGSKRFLISASIGSIRFADSLESFDITIGYDRNVLRPTDVLKEGTLSGQMSNGPTMNIVVPGEMRIFGFNVARSVSGNIPLVAVAGDFIGSCVLPGVLTIPYPPDFNSEFKKRISVSIGSQVVPVAIPKTNPNAGCQIPSDSVELDSASNEVAFEVNVGGYLGGGRKRSLELKCTRSSDTAFFEISRIQGANYCVVDSVVRSGDLTKAFVTVDSVAVSSQVLLAVSVSKKRNKEKRKVELVASVKELDSCSCVRPVLEDSILIVISPVVTSVASSVDDHICTVNARNGNIIGECDHEQMKSLSVFDLYGRMLRDASKQNSTSVEVSSDDLPSGVYLVRMQCGRNQTAKTIVK